MNKPTLLFESHSNATIERATATFGTRGDEYGDTWRECQFLKMKAVAKALGIEIKPEHFRALATAAFCDLKYWRLLGGYKDDHLLDAINYDAFLAEEMRILTAKKKFKCVVTDCTGTQQEGSPYCEFHLPIARCPQPRCGFQGCDNYPVHGRTLCAAHLHHF